MKRRNFFGSLIGASALGVVASKVEADPEQLAYSPKTTSFKTKGVELCSSQLKVAQYFNDDQTREIGYFGGKGVGKTFLHCHLLYNYAMEHPGATLAFARRTLHDARKFFVLSMKEYVEDYGDKSAIRFNGQENFFEFKNGSRLFLFETKERPSDPRFYWLGSVQLDAAVIEHASEISEVAVDAVMATLRKGSMKLIVSAIPPQRTDPVHWLYDRYYMPAAARMLPKGIAFVQGVVEENEYLREGYLDGLRSTLSEGHYKRIVQGNWNIS